MTDDDETPKLKPTLPRMQSQTERDLGGIAARKERDRERDRDSRDQSGGFASEPVTGNYEGEALRLARSRRPTPERIEHLEDRVDDVVTTIGEWRAEVGQQLGGVSGAIGALAGEVRGLRTVVETASHHDRITFKSQVEVETAQELDVIDKRKTRRRWVTAAIKIIPGAIALATAAFAAGRC